MKKVIFLFLMFISIGVNALERTHINYNYVDGYYYNGIVDGKKVSYNAMYMEHNGETLYCLGFSIPISRINGYEVYDFNSSKNYTLEQKRYMQIIAYFGYGYKGNYDMKYYFATQELIWEATGSNVYWTKSLNGTDIIDLNPYKEAILKLYQEYISEENNSIEHHTLEVGSYYVIEDPNHFLDPYEFNYVGKNEVIQTSEGILINPYLKGKENIYLERKFDKPFQSELFLDNGFQPVLKSGDIVNKVRIINLDIKNTSVIFSRINKNEEDPNYSNRYLEIEGAVYDLYDSNREYLTTFRIDETGKLTISDLPLGNYFIQETAPSYGFKEDSNFYEFSLIFGNTPLKHNLYASPITKKLNITNIYKIDGILYKEKDIVFEIHRDGKLYSTLTTNEEGNVSIDLEYGEYLIRQKNAKEGFVVEPDFMLSVNDKENKMDYIFIKELKKETEEVIEKDSNEIINEDTSDEENILENNSDEKLVEDSKYIPITKEISLDFENGLNLEINELPQLNSNKDLVDIICEKLLFLFFL